VPKLDLEKFTALIEKHQIDIRLGQLFSTLPLYNDCFRINIGFDLTEDVKREIDLLADAIRNSL